LLHGGGLFLTQFGLFVDDGLQSFLDRCFGIFVGTWHGGQRGRNKVFSKLGHLLFGRFQLLLHDFKQEIHLRLQPIYFMS